MEDQAYEKEAHAISYYILYLQSSFTLLDVRVAGRSQVARQALWARRQDRTRESGRASPRVRRASRATWAKATAAGSHGSAHRARRAPRRGGLEVKRILKVKTTVIKNSCIIKNIRSTEHHE